MIRLAEAAIAGLLGGFLGSLLFVVINSRRR